MEPARTRATLTNAYGSTITLVGIERDLEIAIARMCAVGWWVTDEWEPTDVGRFPVAPTPFRPVRASRRSIA